MKNTLGNNLQISIFGESHGEGVGVVVAGFPSGILIDEKFMKQQMEKRKSKTSLSTARQEMDEVELISGVFNGVTTGAPCCFYVKNKNQDSKDYEKNKTIMRPSHVDYAAHIKYQGNQDYRGGGHFSGRLTAPLVASGAIALQYLQNLGIKIGSHVVQLHDQKDDLFSSEYETLNKQIDLISKQGFPVLSEKIKQEFEQKIEQAKLNQDSVGGIIETAIMQLPIGLGEPFFDSLESRLAHAVFSIGGVKGVEFGLGFQFADQYGSEVNDQMEIINGKVKIKTNNNGGILGGLSTGEPVIMKTVIKPTASIGKKQKTVDISTNSDVIVELQGRHDPALIYRVSVVVDSLVALVVMDCLMEFSARGAIR
ncbi:MAG: chorismate synthase [Anaerorhabdus sp.]